ncbi:protein of unknown function [Pseudodesulfovibrio profundus]|uniref:Uncharacterized protein n=2 Tax=Pseudodesulfovibrio profundus TaxID=57320 RepID=A0A2C8F509_9BACT|nr:protein of unknown function [Pseudodesulfovibrio profundus]
MHEATSDLLRLMDAHDIGNTKVVVVDGDTSGVVSLGTLNAVFMAAFGSSHLLVGGGHEPLYDILTKSVDLLMNAKIIARCVLGEVEKAGADRAIISDTRKAIQGEDE